MLWASIKVGIFTSCIIFAIVNVFPDPVTPNNVAYFSLLFIALTIDFIACGWSPVGLKSDFNSKSKYITPSSEHYSNKCNYIIKYILLILSSIFFNSLSI